MSHSLQSKSFITFITLIVALLLPAIGKPSAAKTGDKKDKLQLRLVCVSSLAEGQEVIVASRDADGKWLELDTIELRPSLITDWLPAAAGNFHLAVREKNTLKSICNFDCATETRRALVILTANAETNTYEANVVDPDKIGFVKGSLLMINLSAHTGLVTLGTKEEKIEAGKQAVTTPVTDESEMYRMLISYQDAEGKVVPRYDRYVSGNPKARDMLFLLPDKTVGVKVLTLALFGSFD